MFDSLGVFQAEGMDALQQRLEMLDPNEIADFQRIFTDKFFDAYRNDLWAAAYIIGGGCSDDGFMDFRSELIAHGRAIYEAAMKNPETLADLDPAPEGL